MASTTAKPTGLLANIPPSIKGVPDDERWVGKYVGAAAGSIGMAASSFVFGDVGAIDWADTVSTLGFLGTGAASVMNKYGEGRDERWGKAAKWLASVSALGIAAGMGYNAINNFSHVSEAISSNGNTHEFDDNSLDQYITYSKIEGGIRAEWVDQTVSFHGQAFEMDDLIESGYAVGSTGKRRRNNRIFHNIH